MLRKLTCVVVVFGAILVAAQSGPAKPDGKVGPFIKITAPGNYDNVTSPVTVYGTSNTPNNKCGCGFYDGTELVEAVVGKTDAKGDWSFTVSVPNDIYEIFVYSADPDLDISDSRVGVAVIDPLSIRRSCEEAISLCPRRIPRVSRFHLRRGNC